MWSPNMSMALWQGNISMGRGWITRWRWSLSAGRRRRGIPILPMRWGRCGCWVETHGRASPPCERACDGRRGRRRQLADRGYGRAGYQRRGQSVPVHRPPMGRRYRPVPLPRPRLHPRPRPLPPDRPNWLRRQHEPLCLRQQ